MLTSRLSGDENPYTTHFYTGLVGAVVMSGAMLFTSWRPDLLPNDWPWFLRVGFATLGGWLVFDHVPDALTWMGIAIIAASGVANTVLSMLEVLAKTRVSEQA